MNTTRVLRPHDNVRKVCPKILRPRSNAITKKSNTATNTFRSPQEVKRKSSAKMTPRAIESQATTSFQFPILSCQSTTNSRGGPELSNLNRETVSLSPRMWPAILRVYDDRIVRVTMLRTSVIPPHSAARFLILSAMLASGFALSTDSQANSPTRAIRFRNHHSSLDLGIPRASPHLPFLATSLIVR